MTGARYDCAQPRRRDRVRERAEDIAVNGIDYVEVGPDGRTLAVHFLSAHGLAGLQAANFTVEGGERVSEIAVAEADVDVAQQVATVVTSTTGDFSPYRLQLRPVGHPGSWVFDGRLSSVSFRYRTGCPDPYDCLEDHLCATPAAAPPELDYLAKDYAGFRQLLLDRMTTQAPAWTERNPADVVLTLVELLAAVADGLSYTQDAAATEAHLGTARLRRSVSRHARLLGYTAHNGCNARAFVRFTSGTAQAVTLPPGVEVVTGAVGPLPAHQPLPAPAVVFRTLHPVTVQQQANRLPIHTWSDDECCLPVGATGATLVDAADLALEPGAFLLLEETAGPEGGPPDAARRHVVRLTAVARDRDDVEDLDVLHVQWAPADALPFGLCVSGRHGTAAAARGGIAVAEHASAAASPLAGTPRPSAGRRGPAGGPRPYRPRLPDTGLTFAHDYDPTAPAVGQLRRDPRHARPALVVTIDGSTWTPPPGPDLLRSGPGHRHVLAEVERDGSAWLRFGDGTYGARPPDLPVAVHADYSTGNGTAGNVGRQTLTAWRVPLDVPELAAVTAVTNPLPAAGGVEAEPAERIRTDAPHAFRVQHRAVTAADYAAVLGRHPAVQQARARLRWTGSWHTVFLAVDLLGGRDLDAATERLLRDYLDGYRMAGHDVELTGPVHVSVDLALRICVEPGVRQEVVRSAARDVLSSGTRRDGRLGLFHPDRFTFGQPLLLSEVIVAVAGLPGVSSVHATRFRRFGRRPDGELEDEVLRAAPQEIVRLAGDRNAPERGRLELDVRGGS